MKNKKIKSRFLNFFGKKQKGFHKGKLEREGLPVEPIDSNKLKVGIIGAGRMGITHYSIVNGLDNVSVVAVADTSQQLLSMFDKYMDIDCYENWNEMLTEVSLDAVLICTPPSLNAEILEACAEAKTHVFIEKPFLINSQKAEHFAKMFAQRKLVNQVGYVNRYNAVFLRVKELIESQAIGDLVRFKSEMFSSTVSEPQSGVGWRANQKSGGGVTYEMATHAIDLVLFLFGHPGHISGTGFSKVFSKNVDDIVSTNFSYENGLLGSLFVNWSDCTRRKPVNSIEIIGRRGSIFADQYELKIFMNVDSPESNLSKGWNIFKITDLFYSVPFYVRGNEFTLQLDKFVEDIRTNSVHKASCSFFDAAKTLNLIESMYADFNENKQKEFE